MSGEPLRKFCLEVFSMCNFNGNGMCGGNCWWIIILIVLLCSCGGNGNTASSCGCDHNCC